MTSKQFLYLKDSFESLTTCHSKRTSFCDDTHDKSVQGSTASPFLHKEPLKEEIILRVRYLNLPVEVCRHGTPLKQDLVLLNDRIVVSSS